MSRSNSPRVPAPAVATYIMTSRSRNGTRGLLKYGAGRDTTRENAAEVAIQLSTPRSRTRYLSGLASWHDGTSTPTRAQGLMMPIRLYWHRQYRNPNFGDEISPKIVEMLASSRVVHADPLTCRMASTGSILWKVIAGYMKERRSDPLLVWGSGLMQPIRLSVPTTVTIAAVRGPLTRYSLPNAPVMPLGDPGLFARELFESVRVEKRIRVGLIPHQGEKNTPILAEVAAALPGCELISINGPNITDVARSMKSCDFIVSSSLHGLIVADSFGIPNAWMKIGEIHEAAEYKFYDYFISVDRPIRKYRPSDFLGGFREDIFDVTPSGTVTRLCEDLRAALNKHLAALTDRETVAA
jgi:pyruvyltransferase